MQSSELVPKKRKTLLPYVYLANILLSIHFFLIIYINSTVLEQFFTADQVGILFIVGAIIGILFFLSAPNVINRFGLSRYLFSVIALECIAILGLAGSNSALSVAFYFLMHNSLVPMILFCLDIFLEKETHIETDTGKIRSIFLTISNTILVISPAITGLILKQYSFATLYFLSALFCLPLLLIVRKKFSGTVTKISEVHIITSMKKAFANKDVKNVVIAQFILQFFYAWMVIYLPLYLVKDVGFGWQKLGLLFTVMLIPFAVFEIPVGFLADKKYGEKEFMLIGFIIMAVASSLIPFVKVPVFITWATLLFCSRIGASFSEITSESYFFKQVNAENSDSISIFRMTRPVAYICAPIIATITLTFLSLGASFWILGIITFFGSVAAFNITDTN
jgi:MFS family permease